jgi:TonB-dependent SusC/RagA subfamily outer membrane receptor
MQLHFSALRQRFLTVQHILVLGLLLGILAPALAFSAEVRGVVTDETTGEPMAGANVLIKGTTIGAATDANGRFVILNAPNAQFTLRVTFIGYKPFEKTFSPADDLSNLQIRLIEDVFQTEAIVVTGIANTRSKSRSEVTVARVSAKDLTDKNDYTSLDQLIASKMPGVQLRSSSGNVGSGFRFFVRSGGGLNGNEQPVIYVDGVRVDNAQLRPFFTGGQGLSTLADLSPDQIESIEVLKGPAAAASYGTNGSNGVVLIKTKRGNISPTARGGLSVNYKLSVGTNTNSFEYDPADFVSANDANGVFRNGDIMQQSINISGGNNFIKYFTSYENRDETGIVPGNSQKRNNLRANIDVFPSDKFSFTVTAGFNNAESQIPQNDNNTRGWLGNTLLFARSYRFTDSLSIANLRNDSESNRFVGSFQASWTPIRDFEAKFSIGVDNSDLRWDETLRADLVYGGVTSGQRQIWTRNNKQTSVDLNARYNYTLGGSIQVTSIVGAQLFNRRNRTAFASAQNFSTPLIMEIGAGANFLDKGETKTHIRQAGVFTTHQLSYNDRYFMTLGLRNDFASSIGKNAPEIFYPQASFAVRLDQFQWFPRRFNLFKVRAAYGETGILPNFTDGVPLLWTAETGAYGAGAVLSAIGNAEITPERVREVEVGFDTELSNYALEFTYYIQRARESIIDFRNPPSTGKIASAVPFNVGRIDGQGVEVLLQGTPLRFRNLEVNFSLNSAWQTNEVKDLGGAQPIFDGFDINVTKEGLRNHEFYYRQVVGALFNEDGTYAGPDLTEDRVPLGNPIPNYTGSFTLNFRLMRNFNVYVLTDWATGQRVYNNTKRFAVRFGNNPEYNRLRYQLGLRSSPPEGEENLTQFSPGTAEYNAAAERIARLDGNVRSNFIEDADYLKLREISVNYNLRGLLRRWKATNLVKNLVIGVSGRNLWTTTKYSGPDPEVNFAGARSLSRGQDFLTLQHPRSYTMFLQVGI